MTITPGRVLSLISRVSLCALAFLVPVVVFPWTTDILDFNKYLVLVVLGTVCALSWIGSMVAERSVQLKTHWFFLIPLLFIGATAISSAFSLAPYTSWLGDGSQEYTAFLGTLLLGVVFIAASNLLTDAALRRNVVSALLIGSGVLGLFVLLSFVGVPLGILSNTVGIPTALALYFLVMTMLGNGTLLVSGEKEGQGFMPQGPLGTVTKVAIAFTSVTGLLLLLSIDSTFLWIVTLVGLVPLFAFVLALPKDFTQPLKFVFPLLLLVSALIFLFLPSVIKNPYPLEVAPSMGTTLTLTQDAWKEKSAVFGSGPGTFSNVYTKYAPPSVNQTIFWDTRFDRGASHVLTVFATHGLLGGIIFLIFLVTILGFSVQYLLRSRVHGGWRFMYGPFAAWSVLAIGAFLFPQNLTLAFILMLLSALLASQMTPMAKDIAFAKSPRLALGSAFVFMLLGVLMLMVLFVSISRYSAEIVFAQAVSADEGGKNIDDIIAKLNSAATRNRWSDLYFRNLGNALLMKTAALANDSKTDSDTLKNYVAAAINSGLEASNLAPNTVMNWELRGTLYRELSPLLQNSNDLAIASFKRAVELAPSNPRYQVGLARTYIVRADLLRTLIEGKDADLSKQATEAKTAALTSAKEALDKAIALKSDYTPASYYQAFVAERQGDLAEAVKSMELVKATDPSDVGVGIQLGLLYLRQGKNDLAQAELERVLTIAPDFANARWYLSVIYEDKGDKAKAIEELEAIQKTNPDDTAVKSRLERLKNGGSNPPNVIPDPLTEDTAVTDTGTTPPATPNTTTP
jgi:tetratricopeptide (TPR) repeat protein